MRFHAVNTAVVQPCYLATNFIGATGGQRSDRGAVPPGHPLEPPLQQSTQDSTMPSCLYHQHSAA